MNLEDFDPTIMDKTELQTGYLHHSYAESLSEFGDPHKLPRSGGWILNRPISGFEGHDAMGCYPLFACQEWKNLTVDLEVVDQEIVSLTLVADPFGNHTPDLLHSCFPDLMVPFKEHFVVDLGKCLDSISQNHRRNSCKALAILEVELCSDPIYYLDDWIALYGNLIERHSIQGIATFSRKAFEIQLRVPGTTVLRAISDTETVGMLLWYRQGDVAYYHLGAYNARGYELRASFALFMKAIEHYQTQGARWLSLGAGAGLDSSATDGLTRFKRGWATETRTAYLCGRIFNRKAYDKMVQVKNVAETSYFPAYRSPSL